VQERRGRNAAQSTSDPERLAAEYETLVRERLKFLPYAPVIFVSALTGEHVEELYALIDRVAEARKRRITTGELNRWLATVDLARGTSPSAHRVKIYYMTQSAVSPPTFIIFTNQRQRLHFSYERFLENRLRAHFDFFGSPIRFIQRFRERGRDDQERPARKRRRAD
jgi:GTP-binding protein